VNVNFREEFQKEPYSPELKWYNEPQDFSVAGGQLVVRPDTETDFWQKTYYGFTPDSGHLLYLELAGDFELETHVHFRFANEYDQAGLMIRTDPEHWLKTSVEYQLEGPSAVGVVMTDIQSNWSLAGFEGAHVYLRVRRLGDVLGVYRSLDGESWWLMRMGPLPMNDPVQAGIYACSPVAAGLEARFDYVSVSPPTSREFH
jgi:regulation of enolase protein 1 (concanavalin A-like superfamily)